MSTALINDLNVPIMLVLSVADTNTVKAFNLKSDKIVQTINEFGNENVHGQWCVSHQGKRFSLENSIIQSMIKNVKKKEVRTFSLNGVPLRFLMDFVLERLQLTLVSDDKKLEIKFLPDAPLAFLKQAVKILNSDLTSMKDIEGKKKLLAIARRMASVACASGCLMEASRFPQIFSGFDHPILETKCLDLKVRDIDISLVSSDQYFLDHFETFSQQQNDNELSEATLRSLLWDGIICHIFMVEEGTTPSFNLVSELDVREVFSNVDFRLIDLSVLSKKYNVPLLIVEIASARVNPDSYHKDFTKLAALMCFACEDLAKKMYFSGLDFHNIVIQGILIGHTQFEFFTAHPILDEVEIVEEKSKGESVQKKSKTQAEKSFQFSVSINSNPHWKYDLFQEPSQCKEACCTSNIIKQVPAKNKTSLQSWSNSANFLSTKIIDSFWEEFDPYKVAEVQDEKNPFAPSDSDAEKINYSTANSKSLCLLIKFCGYSKRLAQDLDKDLKCRKENKIDQHRDHASIKIIWPDVKRRAIPQARDSHTSETANRNRIRDYFFSTMDSGSFTNAPPSLDMQEMNRMKPGSTLQAIDVQGRHRIVTCCLYEDFRTIFQTHNMLSGCPMFQSIYSACVNDNGFYIMEMEPLEIITDCSIFKLDFLNKFDYCTIVLEGVIGSIELLCGLWWMHNVAGIAHASIRPSSLCYSHVTGLWKLVGFSNIHKTNPSNHLTMIDPKSSSADIHDLAFSIWSVFGTELQEAILTTEEHHVSFDKDITQGVEILKEFYKIIHGMMMISENGPVLRAEEAILELLHLYRKYCDHDNFIWRQEGPVLLLVEKILKIAKISNFGKDTVKVLQERDDDDQEIADEQDENRFNKNVENSFSTTTTESEKFSISSSSTTSFSYLTSEDEEYANF